MHVEATRILEAGSWGKRKASREAEGRERRRSRQAIYSFNDPTQIIPSSPSPTQDLVLLQDVWFLENS